MEKPPSSQRSNVGSAGTSPTTFHPQLPYDATTFEQIFEQYRADISAYLSCRIGLKLKRRVDAQDLVQETYIAASQRYAEFCQQGNFPVRIWLLKTAQQQLIDAYRHHVGSVKRSIDREQPWCDCSSAAIAQAVLNVGSSPSKQLRYEELHDKLSEAINLLGHIDQEILLMRHFENRPYAEIAEMLELEETTLRQRFGRALLKLREITKQLGLLEHLT